MFWAVGPFNSPEGAAVVGYGNGTCYYGDTLPGSHLRSDGVALGCFGPGVGVGALRRGGGCGRGGGVKVPQGMEDVELEWREALKGLDL